MVALRIAARGHMLWAKRGTPVSTPWCHPCWRVLMETSTPCYLVLEAPWRTPGVLPKSFFRLWLGQCTSQHCCWMNEPMSDLSSGNCVGATFPLTAPSCCSQMSGALHLCTLLQSATFSPRDHLPADDFQRITHSIYRNYTSLTAHLNDYGKWVLFFFFASVGTTTMETCLINSLEQFSFLWATGKHPTQLWYTLNRISMRLKILIVSLKFIVGRFQHLYASRFVFLRHSIQPVYHLQY